MKHDHDDTTIGTYLAGELALEQREAFETHLLTCDRCWAEIDAGRRGRALAEQAREPAPEPLREQLLAALAAGQPTRRRPAARILVAAAVAVVVALTAAVVVIGAIGADAQPAQIAAAVNGYRDDRLPGSGIPERVGPDLSVLRMVETGAGTGRLAGQPVAGFAYRDEVGRRLVIYLSDQPFPMPEPADHADAVGAAITTHRGVAVLCSRAPHIALVLGEDEHLVWQAATVLDLT